MVNKIQKQEDALLNAFEIQILEERLEMAPWDSEPVSPTTGWPESTLVK